MGSVIINQAVLMPQSRAVQHYIDSNGNAQEVGGSRASLNVNINEVDHTVVNELFHRHMGVSSTLLVASAVGDINVTVVNGAAFTVNNVVQINDGNIETTFPVITGITTNVLTFDRPLDYGYNIGDTVEVVDTDLKSTVGSLATPIIYTLTPTVGEIWHIHRIILSMTHTAAATDDKFGSITALANGVVLRAFVDGQFFSFTNWKVNRDIILDMYDITYSDKAGSSLFGTSARGSFSLIGVAVRLDGDAGDYMDVLIQDDISTLSSFFINVQGHVHVVVG